MLGTERLWTSLQSFRYVASTFRWYRAPCKANDTRKQKDQQFLQFTPNHGSLQTGQRVLQQRGSSQVCN